MNQHYDDVLMSFMASQITSLTIIYSTVYLSTDQRKHQSSASLAFVRGIHRVPGEFPAQMASNAENVSILWRHHVWFFTPAWAHLSHGMSHAGPRRHIPRRRPWTMTSLNLYLSGATLIARFMGATWVPSWADRTQVGPMLAPWTFLPGQPFQLFLFNVVTKLHCDSCGVSQS